jgi:WhiB family redox-sensing transcriptional regulator
MSNILNDLGIDPEDLEWWDLAACKGMDTNLFYDKYESDVNIAKSIDQACLSCPVAKNCLKAGIEGNEYGIWGGIYLNSGSTDKARNIHKTELVWKQLKVKHGH